MRIITMRVLEGPNIFSYHPVLRVKLDIGRYETMASNVIPGFVGGLLAVLPGLRDHQCCRGYRGGFVERLQEGTYLAHIFEHVALELQFLAGDDVKFGQTRGAGRTGVYNVVFGFRRAAVAEQAAWQAEKLLQAVLAGRPFAAGPAVAAINRAADQERLGPSTAAIRQAAIDRGIPVSRVDNEDLLVLGYGCRSQKVWATVTGRTPGVAIDLAGDKYLTKRVLQAGGIPVPFGMIVKSAAAAASALAEIGAPVAVKPLTGNQGKGVTLAVTKAAAVKRAFETAAQYDANVLVEEYISGRQYRLCVVNGTLVAAAERIPALVTGDGRHTVQELVALANDDPRRGEGHEKPLTKIRIDAVAIAVLAKQGLAPYAVPPAGQAVYIRENANLSTGGTAIDVTDRVHPDNVNLAERIAALIGLDVAGIDLVTEDIGKPVRSGQGAVIEVNAAPGIRMHHYPSAGQPRDVAGRIIDYLFPAGETGRIPIIAITGTNGKTTVTRMISHIWRLAGYRVGMTSTDGIYINDKCLIKGDTTGPDSAKVVLTDPTVEVAVLETARGGIMRGGLAFDQCDVGIVTNITEDHIGQDGIESLEDLAYIKALVPETVRAGGVALLNADDPWVTALAPRLKGEIVYFSLESGNVIVKRHLGLGGKAFFVKNGLIYVAGGAWARSIVKVADVPATLGGIAQHNLQNAVIAAAACYCLNVPLGYIRQGLSTFAQNPGRLTLLEVGDFRVCVDYGHNPAGYQALIKTVRGLKADRVVGVIAAPGDRRNDVITNIGRIAGQGFDFLYIKEDGDLRGRRPGETADLLRQGALAAGFPANRIITVLNEATAVRRALEAAAAGDLVVVFYESFETVMKVIKKFTSRLPAFSGRPGGKAGPEMAAPAAKML